MIKNYQVSLLLLTFALITTTNIVHCSPGDKDPKFKSCLSSCTSPFNKAECEKTLREGGVWLKFPFYWDCESNCKYECMWQIELNKRQKMKEMTSSNVNINDDKELFEMYKTVQYYGKWPFIRVFGMQEFFSVIFSAACGYTHWINYKRSTTHSMMSSSKYDWLKFPFTLFTTVSVVEWIASSVYHSRDLYWTEKLDYFGAVLHLLFSVYVLLILVMKAKKWDDQLFLLGPIILYYIIHILVLSYHWDYGWNMLICITISGICNILLLTLCWRYKRYSGVVKYGLGFMVMFMACSMLELLDFSPIGDLLDAHACWHAAGIPLIWLWYQFLRRVSEAVILDIKTKDFLD